MWGKQLADTRCGLMILPLLSYVTEQVTARTGIRNRYDHCLLTCANWIVFLVGVYFHLITFKFFQPPFHFIHLDRNPSPFKFPSIHLTVIAKIHGEHSSAKHSSVPSRASALTWSCMSSMRHPPHCNYCQSLWPELRHQVCGLSLQFLDSILYQTGCEGVFASFCLMVMIIRALCPAVFLQNIWTMFFCIRN